MDFRPRVNGMSNPFDGKFNGKKVLPQKPELGLDNGHTFGAISSCVSTFIGVFFFIVTLGLMLPVFRDTCVIAEDGTCGTGCDCITVDVERTPPGMYPEYSKQAILILAVAVGALRFLAAMIMGRWSSSSMDWFNEIALGLKNWLVGDHYVYWKTFLAESVAYVTASFAATAVLVGMNDGIQDLGLAQLTRHGSGAYKYRSHISLALITFFGTLFFVWSRYKFMYQGADRYLTRQGTAAKSVGNMVKYAPLWPKLGHHYGEAAMNGMTWFVLALATGMFVGPAPLFFWQTFWTGIFDAFNGGKAFSGSLPDPETHYLMFLLYPLLRLAAPFFMWFYLWAVGGLTHKRTD